jgi:hypothetical protein
MIWRIITSEWVKFRRSSLLCGAYGAVAGVATLITVLVFAQAGNANTGGHVSGPSVSLAALARPDGALYGLSRAATFLGVVARAVALGLPKRSARQRSESPRTHGFSDQLRHAERERVIRSGSRRRRRAWARR